MASSKVTYHPDSEPESSRIKEEDIEKAFINKLTSLKYTHRPDIRDLNSLEDNFREKFEKLNAVTLSDAEFERLLDQITTPDVYKSAETLRQTNSFERDDGTPLNFTWSTSRTGAKTTSRSSASSASTPAAASTATTSSSSSTASPVSKSN